MPRNAAVCLVALLASVAGCAGNGRIVEHMPGEAADMTTVSYRASYTLFQESPAGGARPVAFRNDAAPDTVFHWDSATENSAAVGGQVQQRVLNFNSEGDATLGWGDGRPRERLTPFDLHRHENIGFEWGQDGHLFAVAGLQRIPLEDGRYFWQATPETERRGADRTWHEFFEAMSDGVSLELGMPGAVLYSLVMMLGSGGWG
jgi:hypothetical protein